MIDSTHDMRPDLDSQPKTQLRHLTHNLIPTPDSGPHPDTQPGIQPVILTQDLTLTQYETRKLGLESRSRVGSRIENQELI